MSDDPPDLAGRLLDGNEFRLVGEHEEHFGGDVDPVGDGVVVDHDREPRRLRDGPVVGDGLPGVGLVLHGGKRHEAGEPHRGRDVDEPACAGGGGLGDAREHRHAAVRGPDGGADHVELFVGREGRVFPQRTQDDEAVNAGVDLRADVPFDGGQVEREVGFEFRREGGEDALPGRIHGMHRLLGEPVKYRRFREEMEARSRREPCPRESTAAPCRLPRDRCPDVRRNTARPRRPRPQNPSTVQNRSVGANSRNTSTGVSCDIHAIADDAARARASFRRRS